MRRRGLWWCIDEKAGVSTFVSVTPCILEHTICNCPGCFCEEAQYPIAECGTQAQSVCFFYFSASWVRLLFVFSRCVKAEGVAVDMASYLQYS